MSDHPAERSDDVEHFEPTDPDFESKVHDSFSRQTIMDLIGAQLTRVEPGYVEIELGYREELTQQHDFIHAGITTTIADSAGGYAAFSLMPPGSSILTVEYKINLLAPAAGEVFIGRGRVVKPGRRLFVAEIDVIAKQGDKETCCLFGLQTTMQLTARPDGPPPG